MPFLFFLLLVSMPGRAQQPDTLVSRILLTRSDTGCVNQLYKKGFDLRNSDPQAAFRYGKLCEEAALHSGSEKHLAASQSLLGVLYYKKGNYKTALQYHLRALQLRQHCGDVSGCASSQVNLGNIYSDLNLPESAEAAYLKAIDAYRQAHAPNAKIANCLLNIGALKHTLKQYDAAIENYRLAQELSGLNDYNTKAIFLTNMAEAYKRKGQLEKCIACNEDALKLRMLADNNLETGDNYLNLGDAYLLNHDLLKAKYYLDTAYYIAEKNNYFELYHLACETYAQYYVQAKNFEEAFYWQKKYNTINDSLLVQQAAAKQLLDFNELEITLAHAPAEAGLRNAWLLILVSGFLIFIPLSLLRFKR